MSQSWQTGPQGFSVLLSTTGHTYGGGGAVEATQEELLELMQDAVVLLSHRWNMEFEIRQIEGQVYAWGKQSRFTVGESTIQRALGDLYLQELITFQRGAPDTSFDSALRYQRCKRKWNVPDVVSLNLDDTGGTATMPSYFKKKK